MRSNPPYAPSRQGRARAAGGRLAPSLDQLALDPMRSPGSPLPRPTRELRVPALPRTSSGHGRPVRAVGGWCLVYLIAWPAYQVRGGVRCPSREFLREADDGSDTRAEPRDPCLFSASRCWGPLAACRGVGVGKGAQPVCDLTTDCCSRVRPYWEALRACVHPARAAESLVVRAPLSEE